jgi:uncharacterized membrane protein
VIGLVRFLYLLALAVWIGEIVFFSFIVAPAVFGTIEPTQAGRVVGAIFPRYYALGIGAAVTAVGCALVLGRHAAAPGWWSATAVAVGVGLAATLWAGARVHPQAQRLRVEAYAAGTEPAASEAFRRAHRLAVILNSTALLAGLVGLGLSAAALRE